MLTRQEHLEAAGLSSGEMQDVLDAVASIIEPVRLAYLWRPTLPDAQDDMVLETAINGRAEALVTLNRRHFEPAASTVAVQVVSPAEAVARLRKSR